MNALSYAQIFEQLSCEKRIGFCPFAVIGDPTPKEYMERMQLYLDAQPDFLELGIPFSDPSADGPVIQAANTRALEAGMTPRRAIEYVAKIRALTPVPIGILTYANIALQYGIDAFYRDLAHAGATSVLLADVPLEECQPFAQASRTHGIDHIMIVSENTSEARLKEIAQAGSGFLYLTSTLGVTGVRTELNPRIGATIQRIKRTVSLPAAVGFGISTAKHIQALANAGAQAAIVGSALVKTPLHELSAVLAGLKARKHL